MTKNESVCALRPETSKKPLESVAELAYVSTETYDPAGSDEWRLPTKLVNACRVHIESGPPQLLVSPS